MSPLSIIMSKQAKCHGLATQHFNTNLLYVFLWNLLFYDIWIFSCQSFHLYYHPHTWWILYVYYIILRKKHLLYNVTQKLDYQHVHPIQFQNIYFFIYFPLPTQTVIIRYCCQFTVIKICINKRFENIEILIYSNELFFKYTL